MSVRLFDSHIWDAPWFTELSDDRGWEARLVACHIILHQTPRGGRFVIAINDVVRETSLDAAFVRSIVPLVIPHLRWNIRPLEIVVVGDRRECPMPGRRPMRCDWRTARLNIFERDDYTCQYCGQRGGRLECDHVLPVSRGGADDDANLVTACYACNRAKRDKTPDEWLRS